MKQHVLVLVVLSGILGGCTLSTQGSVENDFTAVPAYGSAYGGLAPQAGMPYAAPVPVPPVSPVMGPQMYPGYNTQIPPYSPYMPGSAIGMNFGAAGYGYGYNGYGYGGPAYGPGSCPLPLALVRSCGGYSGRGDLPPPGWRPWHH